MKSSRAYLTEQVVANIIINFVIAYYIAKATLAALAVIPMQAPQDDPLAPNMAGDLLVGSFIAGLLITLIISKITHWQLAHNKIDNSQVQLNNYLKLLPQSTFKRALFMGLFAALLLAMPVVILLSVLGITQVNSSDYIVIHAVYAALIGGLLAYIVSKRALLD
jgi:hypothetical protein